MLELFDRFGNKNNVALDSDLYIKTVSYTSTYKNVRFRIKAENLTGDRSLLVIFGNARGVPLATMILFSYNKETGVTESNSTHLLTDGEKPVIKYRGLQNGDFMIDLELPLYSSCIICSPKKFELSQYA